MHRSLPKDDEGRARTTAHAYPALRHVEAARQPARRLQRTQQNPCLAFENGFLKPFPGAGGRQQRLNKKVALHGKADPGPPRERGRWRSRGTRGDLGGPQGRRTAADGRTTSARRSKARNRRLQRVNLYRSTFSPAYRYRLDFQIQFSYRYDRPGLRFRKKCMHAASMR